MTEAKRNWQSAKDEAIRVAAAVILPARLDGWADETPTTLNLTGIARFKGGDLEGVETAVLASGENQTTVLVRGVQGVHRERVRYPNRITIHCLEGALTFFVDGQEPLLVEAWREGLADDCDVIQIPPFVRFGWVAIKAFLNYNHFTPALPTGL